jgi:DNA repair protein RecN (Recombination protein N)
MKELARIASGGELSRVMLAVKTILAGAEAPGNASPGGGVSSGNGVSPGGGVSSKSGVSGDATPETLIFDEIDTGIGGEVALSVGEYLAKIGERKQIFCVTHLASIAIRADNHLKVEKQSDGSRTVTTVSVLRKPERREEIARMLAGDSGGAAALAHADALLLKYRRS